MAPQPPDVSDLEKNLSRLISFFPKWSNWMSWSQVLFLENTPFTHGNPSIIPKSALIPSEEYAKRFEELLDKGYSWINMNAFGVWEEKLIVVIELPSYSSNISRDKISVNFSGPAMLNGKPQWDLSKRVELVE